MNLKKWFKVLIISITHKDELIYHFNKINDYKVCIEGELDEIIKLYKDIVD